jgi:DNA-binding HxlR family transcriptional regulator
LAYDVIIEQILMSDEQGGAMIDTPSDHAPRGDLFSERCPSREVLKHVSSRWGILLLVALGDGAHRFGELRRKVGGISEKMLAQTLVWLEQDGFVLRIVHSVAPPWVEYRLTPLGEGISGKLGELAEWIEGNMAGILAAQGKPARVGQRL